MDWNTPVSISRQQETITHHHRIMLLGSCFAEHIGSRLKECHFSVDVNPFGILYNPFSIASSLNRLLDATPFVKEDLFQEGNLWHSFAHHSSFSHTNQELCLQQINRRFLPASENLRTIDYLILTWGTAWVYTQFGSQVIVANCHKLPASYFEHRRLSVEEMCHMWCPLLDRLFSLNSKLKLLLSVSPVRHLQDGVHSNQISKSALMLFTDELCRIYPDRCAYFPAYEIVLDELRDYRFYNIDMVHPSPQAIAYVWEKFSETYFDEETKIVVREWDGLLRALRHRPLIPDKEAYRQFVMQNILKLKNFQRKYTFFDVTEELVAARQLLETLDADEICHN